MVLSLEPDATQRRTRPAESQSAANAASAEPGETSGPPAKVLCRSGLRVGSRIESVELSRCGAVARRA